MDLRKLFRIVVRLIKEFFILAVIGNCIVFFIMGVRDLSVTSLINNSLFSFLAGWPMWKSVRALVFYLDQRVPWLSFPIRRLVIQSLGMIILCTIFILFAILVAFYWNNDGETDYWLQFKSQAALSLKIALVFLIVSSMISNAVIFFKNWKDAAVGKEILKHEHTALKYETLKNQVNPHFLFNSLNALTQLIHTDANRAEQYVRKLSLFYRYVLEQKGNETVTLEEETDALRNYLFLLKIRYNNSLIVDIATDLPGKARVIPLSLQMLLENVVKHNVIAQQQQVRVNIRVSDNGYLVVSNNKTEVQKDAQSTGLGLPNIQNRYRYFSNKPVLIDDAADYFEVSIPLLNSMV